jgi:hypothetical protein
VSLESFTSQTLVEESNVERYAIGRKGCFASRGVGGSFPKI